MQHDAATGMRHYSLKTFAVKVLERNTAARHICNTASNDVLQKDATREGTMQHSCDAPELPALPGRIDERGDFVLTVEAIPALAEWLRAQGWKVERLGDELRCWTGVKPKWRM